MKNFIIGIVCFLTAHTINAQLINDESYLDESFYKFKIKLENAVLNRDHEALSSMLADSINESANGCGYKCPKKEFLDFLFPNKESDEWTSLLNHIRFGFKKKSTADNALDAVTDTPYYFYAPSFNDEINLETQLIILGENVNIREDAGTDKKVVAQLSYEIVRCNCSITNVTDDTYKYADGIDWIQVTLKNGVKGYVAANLTSQNISRDLVIINTATGWKITSYFMSPGC